MTFPMPLHDARVPTRFKLSAAWTSVMFLYIYVDYFELYVPGKLESMLDGMMKPLGLVTQGVLLGTSLMLAVPSLMIFLTLVLGAPLTRWLNIAVGVLYTIIELLVASGSSWTFYVSMSLVEVALTVLIVWIAWHWPKSNKA